MPDFSFTHDDRLIRVDFVYPPIPVRSFDWQATFDDTEDSGPVGHGYTPVEAVSALLENL